MPFVEDFRMAIGNAREAREAYDAAVANLKDVLTAAVTAMVKPGMIIRPHEGGFGRISVQRGNDRRCAAYEVAGPARIVKAEVLHTELTEFVVEAHPLNAAGKRMSGRAGNQGVGSKETVLLHVGLCPYMDDRGQDVAILEVMKRAG